MKQSLGNPARGDAFFERPREIKQILRALDANTSVYLSAPRRVGKTSILQHLEDKEHEGYIFIYTITESIASINDFFKVLYEKLLEGKTIGRVTKISKTAGEILTGLLNKIESVHGVKLREQEEADYYTLFIEVLEKIDPEAGRVVIMIDEFPQTIHNIERVHGSEEACRLIQLNREVRHQRIAENKISFIYTGSISLFPMVERLTTLTAVNDLLSIKVEPWHRDEIRELIIRLSTQSEIKIELGAIDYLLDRIKWYIPFHIQLIYQELVNIWDVKEKILEKGDIDEAIQKTIDAKNKAQFEPYFSRLKNLLEHDGYLFALDVLKYAARNETVGEATIYDLSVKYNRADYAEIIEMLCVDGYLDKKGNNYSYTSPILQLWCLKHICDEI